MGTIDLAHGLNLHDDLALGNYVKPVTVDENAFVSNGDGNLPPSVSCGASQERDSHVGH